MSVKTPILREELTYENWFEKVQSVFAEDLAQSRVFVRKAANAIYTSSLEEYDQCKKLPDNSLYLYNETNLFLREVSLITQRLAGGKKFNIIDLHETTGNTSLPLIYESLASDSLACYVPATVCDKMNRSAINNLQIFAIEANLRSKYKNKLQSSAIQAEIFDQDIKQEVVRIQQAYKAQHDEDTFNVFILLGSALSNDTNPGRTLKNIYDSMESYDYAVISQSLFAPGTEQGTLQDYKNFYHTFSYCHAIQQHLDQDSQEQFVWENDTAKIVLDIVKPVTVAGVDLNPGERVSLFESKKFRREDFESLVLAVGFHVESIVFDDSNTNALYILKK